MLFRDSMIIFSIFLFSLLFLAFDSFFHCSWALSWCSENPKTPLLRKHEVHCFVCEIQIFFPYASLYIYLSTPNFICYFMVQLLNNCPPPPQKLFTVHSSLSSVTLYCETSFFTLPDKLWIHWTRQVLVQILKYSLLKVVHSFFCFFWPWIHPCRTFPFNLELEEEPSWMPRNRQLCLPFLHASS